MLSRDNIGCIPVALLGCVDAAIRVPEAGVWDADARR
jgi:hypothetical protein